MRRLRRLIFLPLALSLVLIGTTQQNRAHAAPSFPWLKMAMHGYHLSMPTGQTKSDYAIATDHVYCYFTGLANCPLSQNEYAEFEAFSFSGATSGPPDAMIAICGHPYVDNAGNLHLIGEHAIVGNTYFQNFGFDPGTIPGTAFVTPGASETSIRTLSGASIYGARDFFTGDTATVTGNFYSNNVTDTLASNANTGMFITLTGPAQDSNYGPVATADPNGNPISQSTTGTMQFTCSTGGPTSSSQVGSPPFYEGVAGFNSDTDGDTFFLFAGGG